MNLLFTGSSSFTGYWMIQSLVEAGYRVTATFQRQSPEDYQDVRRLRVAALAKMCPTVFGCSFGRERFLELLRSRSWDFLCHHGADVTDYKSSSFDPVQALANNAHNLSQVLDCLATTGGGLVLTGSVFEGGEGSGSDSLPHVSPYGLSKGLTSSLFAFEVPRRGLRFGKFVIPNPFGPYEELRFTSYLIGQWRKGCVAGVRTPDYVRDNIPVRLLAQEYTAFVGELARRADLQVHHPSGYIERQGAFAERFAREMRARLGWSCGLELSQQTEFHEPMVRINLGSRLTSDWNEETSWDELAEYYATLA